MFPMDPAMTLIATLQKDRLRTFPRRRHWTEARSARRPRRG